MEKNINYFEEYIINMFEFSEPLEGWEDGEEVEGIWEKEEYGDPDFYEDADVFHELCDYLFSIGGEATLEGNPDITIRLGDEGDIEFSATISYE